MLSYFKAIEVWPDSVEQQAESCVVHGYVHSSSDMKLMAMMLNGVDITEVFGPARVVKVCEKYGLIGGDSL